MPNKLLDLKNDLVFQELFGKQKNKNITAHFLSLILGKEIQNIDLDINKRMLGNRPDSKTGRLDIRAKFNDSEDCNIELQIEPYPSMAERMLQYWSNMYSSKLDSGKEYYTLKPSISILITNYKISKLLHISNYHTTWNLREQNYKDFILTKNIEMHILEIPKIKDDEILKDELVQWLRFIKNSDDKEVQKIMGENKYYKQAREELAYLSGDPDFQRLLESRAGFLMDIEAFKHEAKEAGETKGRAEGLVKGRAEGEIKGKTSTKLEIAKKMKQKNMPLDEIIELTGLTKEEIEKIEL